MCRYRIKVQIRLPEKFIAWSHRSLNLNRTCKYWVAVLSGLNSQIVSIEHPRFATVGKLISLLVHHLFNDFLSLKRTLSQLFSSFVYFVKSLHWGAGKIKKHIRFFTFNLCILFLIELLFCFIKNGLILMLCLNLVRNIFPWLRIIIVLSLT